MSEISLSEAANEIDKWGQVIRAFAKAQEVANILRSADQKLSESKAGVAKAQADLADVKAETQRQVLGREAALAEIDKRRDAAEAGIEAAKKTASDILAKAKDDAASIVEAAKNSAASAVAAAQKSIAQSRQEEDSAKAASALAKQAAEAAKREADQAQADLEKARAELAAFKRTLGAVA